MLSLISVQGEKVPRIKGGLENIYHGLSRQEGLLEIISPTLLISVSLRKLNPGEVV